MWRSLLGATLIVTLVVTLVSGVRTSRADFRDRTDNTSSLFSAAVVEVSHGGSRLRIDVEGLDPTMVVDDCVEVRYGGSLLPAEVALFAAPAQSGGLEPHLLVVIEEGIGGRDGCSRFVPERVVFDATAEELLRRHRDSASAVSSWTASDADSARSYRVTIRVADDNDAQGRSTAFELVLEARPAELS